MARGLLAQAPDVGEALAAWEPHPEALARLIEVGGVAVRQHHGEWVADAGRATLARIASASRAEEVWALVGIEHVPGAIRGLSPLEVADGCPHMGAWSAIGSEVVG